MHLMNKSINKPVFEQSLCHPLFIVQMIVDWQSVLANVLECSWVFAVVDNEIFKLEPCDVPTKLKC